MKKRVFLALFSLLTFVTLIYTATSVAAASAKGNWTSAIRWDANGVSETGTVNRRNLNTFILKVKRANHDTIGTKTVTIKKNSKDVHICWGQPGLDRYGQVLTSCQAHDPWFNSRFIILKSETVSAFA